MAETHSRKRSFWLGVTVVAAVTAAEAVAARPLVQAPAQGPDAFDVWDDPPEQPAGGPALRWTPGRVEIRGMTLRDLMRFVYGAAKFPSPTQFVGGPAWPRSQRFDVDAVGKGEYEGGAGLVHPPAGASARDAGDAGEPFQAAGANRHAGAGIARTDQGEG